MNNPKTIKQLKADPRVDEVFVDPHYEWKYTVYLETGWVAGDRTSTIVGDTAKEILEEMKYVFEGETE